MMIDDKGMKLFQNNTIKYKTDAGVLVYAY